MTYTEILKDIKRQIYHPIYFLAGEEPYFIDLISDTIEEHVLTEQEKEFNLSVLYGRDVDATSIIEYAKRFPMMSNYQVIIVKEAQDIRNIENLNPYVENPTSSTILVICYKNKKLDKRKAFYKSIQKKAIYLESQKIGINKTPDWIKEYIMNLGYTITNKAAMLITEFVGNDISKITNEIEKLIINIPKGTEIKDIHIEENIGISKDYNVFELINALQTKNIFKANKIIFYFANNSKEHSIFALIPILFDFFTKMLIYKENINISDPKEIASLMGINPFIIGQYKEASKLYSREKLILIIGYLKEYDLKAKGVNNNSANEGELMKELIFKILH